jgi:hypothetical protein
MKDLKHIKRFNESQENLNISDVRSSKINEFFGGSDSKEYKHKLEDLNIDAVLEGLDILRHYNPQYYSKYFGDRIFKSYKPSVRDEKDLGWGN